MVDLINITYFVDSGSKCANYPRESFRGDYVITGVRLSVCLSVCYHDN